MLRNVICGVVVCLLGAGLSLGQDVPKPGPEHEKLKQLEGDWKAVMEMAGQKSEGKVTYKSICGGMWVSSDFQGDFAGMKFQGHGLDGYDTNKKKYVSVWVDSMGSAPLTQEGDIDPNTKLLVMTGDSVGLDGKPQKIKSTVTTGDKDHFTFTMYMVQPDGSDQQLMTINYTRQK
jgi:Protein of unknown function (DUF1579)